MCRWPWTTASCCAPTSSGRPARTAPGPAQLWPVRQGPGVPGGLPRQWQQLASQHPDVPAGPRNKYQNWEVVDPEKWVPDGYACVRVDSRGAGARPACSTSCRPRETRDFYECIEWAGRQPWSTGKVGLTGVSYYAMNQWQVARAAPAAPGRDVRLGGRGRLLPGRHPPRRHPVHVLAALVRPAGHGGPARAGRARPAQPDHGRAGRPDRRR